jgi:hypothetical protein
MKRDARLVRLSREHTHALLLARRIRKETPTAQSAELADLYSAVIAFWAAGLLPHFTAEGECLLARLVRYVPDDAPVVARMQGDHLRIAALAATMRDASDDAARSEAMLAFAEELRLHVRWEEETAFPQVETTLSEHELDAVGDDLAARLPEFPLPAPL